MSIRRKKVIRKMIENKGESISKAMVEAGYKKGYAHNPQNFMKTEAVKKELAPIIERIEAERDAALKEMDSKREKAKYSELSTTTDNFTKLSQLLGGKPTGITEVQSPEIKELGLKILEEWKKKKKSKEE